MLVEKQIASNQRRKMRDKLYKCYKQKLVTNSNLTRPLVSFQANKTMPFYRWFKYKEGFSHEFVLHVLDCFNSKKRKKMNVLDPFAGAGTTLSTAAKVGCHSTGIELLPIGTSVIRARLAASAVNLEAFEAQLIHLKKTSFKSRNAKYKFPHIRITEKAFPDKTEEEIAFFQEYLKNIKDEQIQYLFWFASLSVLEEVSYTRKDGQYLRWDKRAGRKLKSNFNKGFIPDFRTALLNKISIMLQDIRYYNRNDHSENIEIIEGSCFDILPDLPACNYDLIITSPPYCNRYDYTRTYALELAYMQYGEGKVKELRQALLSATVENKTKRNELALAYSRRHKTKTYNLAVKSFDEQAALQEILDILHEAGNQGKLNNSNIPTMVENYFFEINLVIIELARVLKRGGHIVMVNDNVQYYGEEVPLDLILSDFAENAGLKVEEIWVLPNGKGNSSQQMAVHGRNEIRKCVYIWSKPCN